MGYARGYHVERYFRESRLLRLAPISQEMVLNYVSQHVLGCPGHMEKRPGQPLNTPGPCGC
jgi:alkylation response protein AidB-like acyl-CoA dehydrogenase